MANKKRIATSVAAVATAAALLLGGTFAWQSISQTALNEASDVINPGGRLHDDFNGTNKDVYVENFADEEIFARVRLEEYFEIVMNKGTDAETKEYIVGYEETDAEGNFVLDDEGNPKKHYEIFTDYTSDGEFGAANVKNDEGETTYSWWNWTTGGETQYLPTFNLNKDSLAADINGTYAGSDGNPDTEEDKYTDYVDYLNGYDINDPVEGDEIYDADTNDVDEGKDAVEGTNIKTIAGESHAITATESATLMSMQEWIDAGSNEGPYWVYDTDGWVYWAQPIPGRNEDGSTNATGLLLDGIELNQAMDDSWYYAINVVAQFITADDLGKTDGTGFYDTEKGTVPSAAALELLKAIGVETEGATMVNDAAALQDALDKGEDVTIGEVTATEVNAEREEELGATYNILWHEGGTVNGGELTLGNAYFGLFINNEDGWPEADDGANTATINGTSITASGTNAAVYTQAIHAPVELNNVTIDTGSVGVWADLGGNTVTLNDCDIISQGSNTEKDWLNSAVAAVGNGEVVINSGTYTGENAVYVYSTGGTIEINGGEFYGELHEDAGELTIKGGTFDHDPTAFVDTENYTVTGNDDGTWTVSEKVRGLYVLYLKDSEGSSYSPDPLRGTDGLVSMVYQDAGSAIAVEAKYYGNADLSLPEGVTIGLAAYGLAEDGWEESPNVSAETVYTAENNPYTFNAETGVLSDDGTAIATINNGTKTITINKVVDNLIVDVYLLKDGERIASTGNSSDVEKLFNSKYFVVSAGQEAEVPAFGYIEVWKTTYNYSTEAGAWVSDYNADSKDADFKLSYAEGSETFVATDGAYHWVRVYDENGNVIPADQITVTETTEEQGSLVKTPDENFTTPTYQIVVWGWNAGITIEYNGETYIFSLDMT